MATRRQNLVRGESGSALVAALVITLVLALLGFALFDLAVVESRLVLGSEASSKAFEVAQAGLDRAFYVLQQDLCGGSPTCQTSPPTGNWGWMDGFINGTGWGPSATPYGAAGAAFEDFPPLVNQAMQTGGSSGTYTVQFLTVNKTGATALALACTAPAGNTLCADVMIVRSTGTATVGQTTLSRTVQAVAQSVLKLNPSASGGVSAGGASGAPINGNALIAGSVHISACPSPCNTPSLALGGGAKVMNNYSAMPPNLRSLVPLLPLACPPSNPGCNVATEGVETLHATVRIAGPSGSPGGSATVSLSGGASFGESAGSYVNSETGKNGKATLDGVFLGAGCNSGASPACSNVVASGGLQSVYSDNLIRAYDILPAPGFTTLSDGFRFNDIDYIHYADCTSGVGCNALTANDFFISHAFKITSPMPVDFPSPKCSFKKVKADALVACDLFAILTGGSPSIYGAEQWNASTPPFAKTFTCGVDAQCNDTATPPKRINGAITTPGTTAQPARFRLSWTPPTLSIQYEDPVTFVFKTLSDLTGSSNVLPILIYVDGPINASAGSATNFYYVGQAAFLAKDAIAIDANLYACAFGACGTDHAAFPQKNLLMFLTPRAMTLALSGGGDHDMMGFFYAGDTATPAWKTTKKLRLAGWVVARTFESSNTANFFEVVAPLPPTSLPLTPLPSVGVGGGGGGGAWWHIRTAKWLECGSALPSGPCP